MEFQHIPVMLEPCMEGLNIRPDGIYVDGTAGGAGHSSEIARRLTTGRLISLDQDPDAVETASQRLSQFPCAQVVRANFRDMRQVLDTLGIDRVDGVLLDLGVSSHQLDTAERGFSYQKDAPLDMRMSQEGVSARDLVNGAPAAELARIFREYGEEKFAWQIARNIVRRREQVPIERTMELAEIIKSSMPAAARREKNPCKRSFQALRIAVNSELDALSQGIDAALIPYPQAEGSASSPSIPWKTGWSSRNSRTFAAAASALRISQCVCAATPRQGGCPAGNLSCRMKRSWPPTGAAKARNCASSRKSRTASRNEPAEPVNGML